MGAGRLLGDLRAATASAAATESTVVVEGASGTGKSVVARAIHRLSPRRMGPLVVLGCASLVESLLDGELFGHAAGAFTGAARDRPGALERAHGGTLVLDDVATLGDGAQARLMRVLSEREVTRLGEDRPRPVDVRVVATSQEPLETLLESGRLRHELFHRLAVVRLRAPSLRELPADDFDAIASTLLERARLRLGRPALTLARDVLDALRRHDWPGNARELENALERAILLAVGAELAPQDFDFLAATPRALVELPERGLDLAATLGSIESGLISRALQRTGDNREQAARLLGLQRTALVQKLKRRRDENEAAP